MKYLLDSDMVNILYDDTRKAHHDALHRRISKLTNEDVLHSSVLVLCELEYSFYNAPDKLSRTKVLNFYQFIFTPIFH